jgi:hypothetical protein
MGIFSEGNMGSLLQQLPNGGAVVAIILVVWIFLNKQDKRDDRMEAMVNRFTEEIDRARKDYLDNVKSILDRDKP